MSWKNQSSRTNTGKHTFVNSNYSLSTNLISEESKILGKGLFYNDVDICGNLTVGGTLVASNIDIELHTFENLEVSEKLLVNGTLGVSGNVDFSNNLFVAGDISCNGTLFASNFEIELFTFENLEVSENLLVNGTLGVSGNVDFSNNLTIGGTISGDYLFVDDRRIHIGYEAGQNNQGQFSVAIGNQAGQNQQNIHSVAIGRFAGQFDQCYSSVAIGYHAGRNNQNQDSIAIGSGAGQNQQSQNSVAIGNEAGRQDQNQYSVAIGALAGSVYQKSNSVAIGSEAGQIHQGEYSVAIGKWAGQSYQGEYSVAIGYGAGDEDQSANSIILNAQDVSLNCDTSGLFIAPIRTSTANNNSLFYDTGTKEVFYSTTGGGGGGGTFDNLTVTKEVFYDIETITVGVLGDISSNSVSGTFKDPTKSNVLLQCLPSFGENAKILSDNISGDFFGYSVAMSGTGDDAVAIVGAIRADGSGGESGAAYLFDVSDGGWAQIGNKIVGNNTNGSDRFGYSVAISGTKAIVGAIRADLCGNNSGAAYLFNVSDGGWAQIGNTIVGNNTDGDDNFGYSVAISETLAIVGAPRADGSGNYSGAAYLFNVSDGGWAQIGNKIVGDDTVGGDWFGNSVAISGTKAIVGAYKADADAGAAYLFDVSNGGWVQKGNTIVGDDTVGGDWFGRSVAMSGTKAIVGAYKADADAGAAYLFDVSDGGWVQKGNTIVGIGTSGGDYFGSSVAISGTGNDVVAIVGAFGVDADAGAAYIFDYKSDTTTYHWDLSGFNKSNQELNIFYDSALNPGVKTQVNFGTNNLSTISGLKSDTLFNENGQSISTRCIGTDGKGRWRTANAAPIEDLTVGGNLIVGGTGLAVLEEFELFCQGQTIATMKGDITLTSVTALQNTSTTPTYDTMNGSEISYTPPTGTTEVIYQFTFAIDSTVNVTTLYFKFFIDEVEQTIAANGIRFYGWTTTTEKALRIPILIGPATDATKCTLLNWTTSKTLKLEVADYGVGHKGILYQNLDIQEPQVAFFVCPQIQIKAIKGPNVTYP